MADKMCRLLFLLLIFVLASHVSHGHTSGGNNPKLRGRKPAPTPSHHYYEKKTETCPDCKCSCEVKPVKEEKKECRWKRVFKQDDGKGQSILQVWRSGGSINEGDTIAEDVTTERPLRCASIIDNWNKNIIDKVKVEIYDEGVREAFFLFDGVASDKMSWFSQERLISSSYSDIKTFHDDRFSIVGDEDNKRRFLIANYNGCHQDCGYLVIGEPRTGGCPWEQVTPKPFILYAKIDACAVFDKDDEIGFADRIVISVRLCDLDW